MRVPAEIAMFVAVAATSIIGLNMSLMLGRSGSTRCASSRRSHVRPGGVFMGKKFGRRVIQAIVVVLLVGVATVSDLEMNAAGTVAAVVSVVSTSRSRSSRIFGRRVDNFLLWGGRTWPDPCSLRAGDGQLITGKWVFDYEWSTPTTALLVSCFFAFRQRLIVPVHPAFSAVSFQVIGHVKACLVFFFGWVIFAAPITSRNIMGCSWPSSA